MEKRRSIEWIRQWRARSDVVVWIDVAKLNASWKRERGFYIARGARSKIASPLRYENVAKWIVTGRRMWMPHIALDDRGIVSFTDGRHRFAWMRDHGVTALPVTASPEAAIKIARRFGNSTTILIFKLLDRLGSFAAALIETSGLREIDRVDDPPQGTERI